MIHINKTTSCHNVFDFRSKRFYLFLICKLPRYFLPSFESFGLLIQEKKRKIDFQDGGHGSHLGFPIGTILDILIYKLPQYVIASFESVGFSVQGKKRIINFQDGSHGGHLRLPIGTILASFYLQLNPMLPTKFHVNWPFGSGREAQNRFSR